MKIGAVKLKNLTAFLLSLKNCDNLMKLIDMFRFLCYNIIILVLMLLY